MSTREAKPRYAKASSSTKKKPSYKKAYKKSIRGIRKSTTSSTMKYPGAGARLGQAIGAAFGPVGSIAGSALGGLAHKAIHALTGFGDYSLPNYELKSNSLLEIGDPPKIVNAGKEFIVRHREYIGDIYSGVAGSPSAAAPSPFSLVSYPINVGMPQTFPWLANVASRFEEYTITGMMFEFKSLYSDAAVQTGGSLGAVVMATEYNAAKPVFANKIEMENYEFAQSSKPSISMAHPIECAPHQTPLTELYIRQPTTNLTGQDIKTYDMGNFQIASQGIPVTGSAQSLGELWVTYEIILYKPRVSNYVDSGFAQFGTNTASQAVGGNFFAGGENWVGLDPHQTLKVELDVPNNKFKIPLFSNVRTYEVVCDVRDPTNSVSQSAACGYFPSPATPSVLNGTVGSPWPQFGPGVKTTVVSGSVITSGTNMMFHVKTDPLSPGNTMCEVTLPSGGCGSGLNLTKVLMVNAIPNINGP